MANEVGSARGNESPTPVDFLTGLPNREAMLGAIHKQIVVNPGNFGLLVVDLDDLRIRNNTQGHAAGDVLLTDAAKVLNSGIRRDSGSDRDPDEYGTVRSAFRFGGDEFAVLLMGVSKQEDVNTVRDRLQEDLEQNDIRASIGGKPHEDEMTPEALLKAADELMYHDKETRKQRAEELRIGWTVLTYESRLKKLPVQNRVLHRLGRWAVRRSRLGMPESQ